MNQTRDGIQDVWGPRAPYYGDEAWPVRVDECIADEPDRWVQSCCVLCTNGCGLDIGVKDGRIVGVRGRADDRVSHGRLGPKGMYAWQANQSADRLTRPLIREGQKPDGAFREASWDEVIDLIARRCRDICNQYTSGAVGFYNSGQLFIEDYYTLSVMAHAGLGTKHLDGNTRLCTATASFALRESFGNDGNPASVTDYDTADCIAHFGHNVANTQTVAWCRILDRRKSPNPPKVRPSAIILGRCRKRRPNYRRTRCSKPMAFRRWLACPWSILPGRWTSGVACRKPFDEDGERRPSGAIMLFWFLAAPVAIIARAFTTEEICREPREYCLRRHTLYRDRSRDCGDTSFATRTTNFALQKFFYVPTCEYCLSFWISLAVVLMAEYRIFFDDWRGVALACFVVMGVANVYLALFSNLRVDARKGRAIAENMEEK